MEVPTVETEPASARTAPEQIPWHSKLARLAKASNRPILWIGVAIVAVIFVFYTWQLYRVGMDLREGVWVYARHDRYSGDIDTAMEHAAEVLNTAEELNGPLLRDGPGLLDAPWSIHKFRERWRRLEPTYLSIMRGWVETYRRHEVLPHIGEDMDYPPMRLLVMTLWTWHEQSMYPGIRDVPGDPTAFTDPATGRRIWATDEVARPLLDFNTASTAAASIAVFFLVWIWVRRGDKQAKWGDSLLLAPVVALGIFLVCRPLVDWQFDMDLSNLSSLIDQRVVSPAWWIGVMLRITSAVCLARFLPAPFRAPTCGLVAATLLWVNPTIIYDSHGWPQWDAWMLPFFFLPALLVSVDWWFTAGLVFGFGCMFKGQVLFAAPVLVLCPLFAGWPMRFLRIVSGLGIGAAFVVWPWLMDDRAVWFYVSGIVGAAVVVAIMSLYRERTAASISHSWGKIFQRKPGPEALDLSPKPEKSTWGTVWPWVAKFLWIELIIACATIVLWRGVAMTSWSAARLMFLLLGAAVLIVPWVIRRRTLPFWIVFVAASAFWVAAWNLGGDFSWWNIGFEYGTLKHEEMELGGNVLSNFGAILSQRYGWGVHDPVGTLSIPIFGWSSDLDLRQAMAMLFGVMMLLCAAGAAVHYRRGDPRFLVALAAPWVLFPAMLTQMSARYFVLPAAMTATMPGVGVAMTLGHFLLTVLGCVQLGNRLWGIHPGDIAPVTSSIISNTHPDLGWAVLLLGLIYVIYAITPRRNRP
jgi:hypothetical protein